MGSSAREHVLVSLTLCVRAWASAVLEVEVEEVDLRRGRVSHARALGRRA
eukprot:COSAG01_NODE_9789_length_2343_cov_3.490642_3_plen_50_part_00